MPTGLSGDSSISVGGDPVSVLNLLEDRVISNLLQTLLGTNQGIDELNILRNDQAFELGIPMPVPGTGT